MSKGILSNGTRKHMGVDIVIPDKTVVKPTLLRRNNGHFILIKKTIKRNSTILSILCCTLLTQFHKANTMRYKVTD